MKLYRFAISAYGNRLKSHIVYASFLLALGSGGAVASTVYKSIGPDGAVVYSAAPETDARSVERLRPPPAPQSQPAASTSDRELLQSFRERHLSLKLAHETMLEARSEVAEAERRRAQAQEPLPGDRVGNSNGTSRLRTQYVERLARHDREVAEARARLDAALQKLREAR